MRSAFFSLLWILLPAGVPLKAADPAPLAAPPNIVLIISDDQAWTDYGFMNHEAIHTPNLDRLAANSALFRRGYTPTPLCRPSLMSIITGRYPHQHQVIGNDPTPDRSLSDEEYSARKADLISRIDNWSTIPGRLKELGYLSLQTGKWWEGNWSRGGFTHGMSRGFPEPGGRHGDDGLKIGRDGMDTVFSFIDDSVKQQKPFFVWYAPFLPHTPHNPPERLLQKYRNDSRPLPLAKYYAMCEWFDESCGQIMDHLDQRKLNENTIVIYVTDNGWIQRTDDMDLPDQWKQSFAPRSKQTTYEGGTRTPVMVSWPGHIKPADRNDLVSTLDVYPTVLAAAGLQSEDDLPGLNLLPALLEQSEISRSVIFGEGFTHDIPDPSQPEISLLTRWCIESDWKLILTYEAPADRYAVVHGINPQKPQLFDLSSDPFERKNLAETYPDVVERLAGQLQQSWNVSKTPVGL